MIEAIFPFILTVWVDLKGTCGVQPLRPFGAPPHCHHSSLHHLLRHDLPAPPCSFIYVIHAPSYSLYITFPGFPPPHMLL